MSIRFCLLKSVNQFIRFWWKQDLVNYSGPWRPFVVLNHHFPIPSTLGHYWSVCCRRNVVELLNSWQLKEMKTFSACTFWSSFKERSLALKLFVQLSLKGKQLPRKFSRQSIQLHGLHFFWSISLIYCIHVCVFLENLERVAENWTNCSLVTLVLVGKVQSVVFPQIFLEIFRSHKIFLAVKTVTIEFSDDLGW